MYYSCGTHAIDVCSFKYTNWMQMHKGARHRSREHFQGTFHCTGHLDVQCTPPTVTAWRAQAVHSP